MKKIIVMVLTFIMWAPFLSAKTVAKKLYIVSGKILTADTNYIPTTSFCEQNIFVQRQTTIHLLEGDSLVLEVINYDTKSHSFALQGRNPINVPSKDSVTMNWSFPQSGVWIFYDNSDYPNNYYQGLCGSIIVRKYSDKIFVWNLREQEKKRSEDLSAGKQVNYNSYEPDYFFINNLNFPDVEQDTTCQIVGKKGERFLLVIANTGLSAHSIHFHGYHGKVIYSNARYCRLNWEKDTYPLEPLESVIIEFSPDKPGLFPVHDHNLVAVSGGGKYPNGMMVMMDIKP